LQEESKGLVYFTDGRVEEITHIYQHVHPGVLSFSTKTNDYVRAGYTSKTYSYYKHHVNKNWEADYILVNNIDHVELK
jgi:hypothetical protein